MWYCDTDELPVIRSGKAIMRHADDEVFHLCERLEAKIKAPVDEIEVTIKVKHGFVMSVATRLIEFFAKTVD